MGDAGHLAQEVGPPESPGGPDRVAPHQWVGVGQGPAQGRRHGGIPGIGDVAQHHQGVAAQVPRLAMRYVPAPVPGHELVVAGRQHLEQVDDRLRAGRGLSGWIDPVGALVGRANLLAVVASVEPIAERGAVVTGERPIDLQQPSQAPPGVDHPGGDDGTGGTSVDATGAATAAIGEPPSARSQRRIGDNRAQHEPAAPTRQEEIGVLAVPADACSVCGLPIDEGVVVGHDAAAPARGLELAGDDGQRRPQWRVVVLPGVAGNATPWRGRDHRPGLHGRPGGRTG